MVVLTRALVVLIGVTTVGGMAAIAVAYDAVDRPARALEYVAIVAPSPQVIAPAAVGLVLLVVARWLRRRPGAPPRERAEHLMDPVPESARESHLRSVAKELDAALGGGNPSTSQFVDTLLLGGLGARASDVHIHPLADFTRVALRIDGMLHEVARLPPEMHEHLVGRLKVMAKLVSFRSNEPQDGHFSLKTSTGAAEVRVSLLPTNHGETAVLRLAANAATLPDLNKIGLDPELLARYLAVLDHSQGIVFVTGPTGAGKTTTIYGSIGYIQSSRGGSTHIATIEDPIEYNVPSLSQTQVNPAAGLTFAKGLRALLRQDPNVIVVGEIRDAETAEIASQAGLTGHLILSTVHAVSAAGVFNRLIDIGVEPFVVASASLACISQRLVRRLCTSCRRPSAPSERERQLLVANDEDAHGDEYWDAQGCDHCGGTGYVGRAPVFELLATSPRIRDLIIAKVPITTLHEAAVAEGMVPLAKAGVRLARHGITNLQEILRIAS